MIQFPYGIADFEKIRRKGMFYLDRTAGIRHVERLGQTLVFLRPRRFGKSLWLRTLATYYDLRLAEDFDTLFGNLDVGREPTPERGSYFVLLWNFSEVSARGSVDEIACQLHDYVNQQIEDFLLSYETHLPGPVKIEADATGTLRHLLTRIRQTPFRLCLLIDEYDNFVNEIMVQDAATYQALFEKDGPFKELFKSVKSGTEGQGLDRVFVTGVSPVALNDLTSGFNNAKDVSHHPAFASLCGFLEEEIRAAVERIAGERSLEATPEELLDTMRTWYNGYRFTKGSKDLVYNPTNALYFLEHLAEFGAPPEALHDQNLRTDRGKLTFLARTSAGSGVIEQLTEGDGSVKVRRLETDFSLDDLLTRIGKDDQFVASFLYYMGLLTLTRDVPARLRIPNLVVRKLFLDRLLEIFLPKPDEYRAAQRAADAFFEDGDLRHLLDFFESSLLSVFSNRDRGAAPKRPGLSGSGVNEMVVKALFLSILFDDSRYVVFSELELERRYADL
ncbi:MAG: AAA family ATPase, partial [bacterium]|nr:AAA family ATPase [bacterium]